MKRIVLALALLLPLTAQAANLTHITPLLDTKTYANGEPLAMPANPELHVMTYELPVGAALPVHKHLYPRYAYVLQGELEIFYLDSKTSKVLKAGEFIAEAPEHWHYGKNIGSVPMKLLVIDHVRPGTATNTELKTEKN